MPIRAVNAGTVLTHEDREIDDDVELRSLLAAVEAIFVLWFTSEGTDFILAFLDVGLKSRTEGIFQNMTIAHFAWLDEPYRVDVCFFTQDSTRAKTSKVQIFFCSHRVYERLRGQSQISRFHDFTFFLRCALRVFTHLLNMAESLRVHRCR